ncbi:MAG: hypothetical protein RIM84_07540 [Alphaproteobacteria bacterium]
MARNPLMLWSIVTILLCPLAVPAATEAAPLRVVQASERDPHVEAVRKAIRQHTRDLDRLMPGEKSEARSLLYRIRSSERRLNRSDNINDKRWIESEMRLRELQEDVQRWIRVHGDR